VHQNCIPGNIHMLYPKLCALHGCLILFAGDYTPDLVALLSADIIIATPEKWDGISRNWQSRAYVEKVQRLLCIVLIPQLLLLPCSLVSHTNQVLGIAPHILQFTSLRRTPLTSLRSSLCCRAFPASPCTVSVLHVAHSGPRFSLL